jgi:hypothetical protein
MYFLERGVKALTFLPNKCPIKYYPPAKEI